MNKIKYFRTKRGITQAELAEIVGVSRSAIAKYEKDERTPPLSLLQKIADALKITLTDLGVMLPENYENIKIVSAKEMFSGMPFLDEIFNGKNNDNNSIVDTFTTDDTEDELIDENKVRNMLIDCILFYFNDNDIYLSFDEMDELFEEIKDYIYFKIYSYKENNKKSK